MTNLLKIGIILLCLGFAMPCTGQLIPRYNRTKKLPEFYYRVQAGFGAHFGGWNAWGVNAEMGHKYFSSHIGIGQVITREGGNTGFIIGVRGYFMKESKNLRVRVTANYGPNKSYFEVDPRPGYSDPPYVAWGLNAGVGFEQRVTDRFYYAMDLLIPFNKTNSYRPLSHNDENWAVPSLGIGFILD